MSQQHEKIEFKNFNDGLMQILKVIKATQAQNQAIVVLIAGMSATGKHTLAQRIKSIVNECNVLDQMDFVRLGPSGVTQALEKSAAAVRPALVVHPFASKLGTDLLPSSVRTFRVLIDGGLWPDFILEIFKRTNRGNENEQQALRRIRQAVFPLLRDACMKQSCDTRIFNEYEPFTGFQRSVSYSFKFIFHGKHLDDVQKLLGMNRNQHRPEYIVDTFLVHSDAKRPLSKDFIRIRQISKRGWPSRLGIMWLSYGKLVKPSLPLGGQNPPRTDDIVKSALASPNKTIRVDVKTLHGLLSLGYRVHSIVRTKRQSIPSLHTSVEDGSKSADAYLVDCEEMGVPYIAIKGNSRESLQKLLDKASFASLMQQVPLTFSNDLLVEIIHKKRPLGRQSQSAPSVTANKQDKQFEPRPIRSKL